MREPRKQMLMISHLLVDNARYWFSVIYLTASAVADPVADSDPGICSDPEFEYRIIFDADPV